MIKAQSKMLADALESSRLRQARREAAYEVLRQKIADDLQQLMAEKNVSWAYLAELLSYTTKETKKRVMHYDLRLGQLVEILEALDMELYPLFTDRRWTEEKK